MSPDVVGFEDQEFAESKAVSDSAAGTGWWDRNAWHVPSPTPGAASSADGFMNIPDGIDEELPFN